MHLDAADLGVSMFPPIGDIGRDGLEEHNWFGLWDEDNAIHNWTKLVKTRTRCC